MRIKHKDGRDGRRGNRAAKPELLSPAGDMDCVYAAVESGCDAVYAGGGEWNARKRARNLSPAELERAVDYCHVRGVKLYVAVNTLIKSKEVRGLADFVESMYLIGADGVIVQDIGCASVIKRGFPDFYLLASTQMSVCDSDGVNFLRENGFDRVILPRELSAAEISQICENTKADIECFIHGALCVCYSGQCLLSAFNGGRSGNRGLCAQPCRLPYGLYHEGKKLAEGEILSLKDMAGLHAIPALTDCGVSSFKIEGRMKGPEYVAGVTAVYRKYIDLYHENPSGYAVDETDMLKLASIFNRSGFCGGYFNGYSGREMLTERGPGKTGVELGRAVRVDGREVRFKALYDVTAGDGVEINGSGAYITRDVPAGEAASVLLGGKNLAREGDIIYRTYDKALMDGLRASYGKSARRLEIAGRFTAKRGEAVRFTVSRGEITAEARAGEAREAKNSPISVDEVRKRLGKTGGTAYVFNKLEIELEDGLFISVGELNGLRRDALCALEREIIQSRKRSARHFPGAYVINREGETIEKGGFSVLVRNEEQLKAVSEYDFARLYVDFGAEPTDLMPFKEKGIQLYKCLPRMERRARSKPPRQNTPWDGFLVRTHGQFRRVSAGGGDIALDYTLNVFNGLSADFWLGKGCGSVCVSPELSAEESVELKSAGTEAVCYGKITLMTTVQCPVGNLAGAERDRTGKGFCSEMGGDGRFYIKSARGEGRYDLLPDCRSCQCLILDGKALTLPANPTHNFYRIEFSNEGLVDVKYIMSTILRNGPFNNANAYAGRYRSGVK